MIEKKTLSLESAIFLLKHVGYYKMLKKILLYTFDDSSLSKRMKEMMIDENEKKEDKDERLLVDLCECYASFRSYFPKELRSIIVPCLLKPASSKKRNEETQKEVEMELLALSNVNKYLKMDKELYLNEIKEIIQYHQKHRNMTRLAYLFPWEFLTNRFYCDNSLEDVIVNELHFAREAAREVKELTRCVKWKRKEEENEKRRKETKEEITLMRWLDTTDNFFFSCTLWNEDFAEIVGRIAQLVRASKANHRGIHNQFIYTFANAAGCDYVNIGAFLKEGATDLILEELQQPTLEDEAMCDCLRFFMNISRLSTDKKFFEMEEAKRKATKRKVFKKMEEEGYEDTITTFNEMVYFIREKYHFRLPLNISDYFANG
eukprot:MONOS_2825.1-p1 / transcript=MONOS_2825.1 / gene=MONOS_2825 / organism=Monocercomonoides_exilis_PA203 / gene_product=unspecified product / transcript_product=unspecified product / location=Mono_scaffold00060:147642-148825(+) / protein_length=375 / sequence_SO=supercontig / SO=protein_coding / is_pseudo=false